MIAQVGTKYKLQLERWAGCGVKRLKDGLVVESRG